MYYLCIHHQVSSRLSILATFHFDFLRNKTVQIQLKLIIVSPQFHSFLFISPFPYQIVTVLNLVFIIHLIILYHYRMCSRFKQYII